MAHAIKVSTGRLDPPQEFVAVPAPPALDFQKKVLPAAAQMVTVPTLLGMNALAACLKIAGLGLKPARGTSDRTNDPGNLTRVVEQSIPTNTQVPVGTFLTIRYGVIPQDMPDATTIELLRAGF
jgi:beta-lactam-binding protein with PASTA domain